MPEQGGRRPETSRKDPTHSQKNKFKSSFPEDVICSLVSIMRWKRTIWNELRGQVRTLQNPKQRITYCFLKKMRHLLSRLQYESKRSEVILQEGSHSKSEFVLVIEKLNILSLHCPPPPIPVTQVFFCSSFWNVLSLIRHASAASACASSLRRSGPRQTDTAVS